MEPQLDPFGFLTIIGGIQGINLAIFLFIRKDGNITANRLLASLVFTLSLDCFISALYMANLIPFVPRLIELSDPLFYLIGPLLFLYIRSLTKADYKLSPRHLLFLIPTLPELINLVRLNLRPLEERLAYLNTYNAEDYLYYNIGWALSVFYHLIFLTLALVILFQHASRIKQEFSNTGAINLRGLRTIIILLLFNLLIQLFSSILLLAEEPAAELIIRINYLFMALLLYIAGYKGLKQISIYSHRAEAKEEGGKYSRSSLSDETAEQQLEKLLSYMDEEKPYLNFNLKSSDIAGELGISVNHLSQIINDKLRKNFYDFVNGYRTEEAKRLLARTDAKDRTLIDIAFDSGFNSKSSFNRVFKEMTSQTPSQFRKGETLSEERLSCS